MSKTFKPMLAAKITDPDKLRFPLLASPKLDGVRAIIRGGVFYSRNMERIPNLHAQILAGKSSYLDGMDGELIVGEPTAPDCFRQSMSGVMSVEGRPAVRFFVFDNYKIERPFAERLAYTRNMLDQLGFAKFCPVVPHHLVNSGYELFAYEKEMLARGYEGVMLRDPAGAYKFGRSTEREGGLMKLKKFEDSEAVILDVEELMINSNEQKKDELGRAKRSTAKAGMVPGGTAGNLIVRDLKSGVKFSIGSGMDDETRARIWASHTRCHLREGELRGGKGRNPRTNAGAVGLIVKYKYFAGGVKEKPRFPVFLGFRDIRDI